MSFLSFFGNTKTPNKGGALGGGILRTIGRFAGKILGSYLDDCDSSQEEHFHYKKQLEVLHLESGAVGRPIPIVFGRARVKGQLIWARHLQETEQIISLAKVRDKSERRKQVGYVYHADFALALCEGEIECIERIWANDLLLDISKYKYTLYKGSQDQMADPSIREAEKEFTCAFRGIAYIVFEKFPLAEFNNKLPSLSFEIVRTLDPLQGHNAQEDVKSVVIIPGSGEFVYDTKIQTKSFLTNQGLVIHTENLNSHNYDNIPDSLYNLEQLFSTCPNLESVGLVICWFGDSLNIKDCHIKPGVEHADYNILTSEKWQVKRFHRHSARLITKEGLHPRYGGTVNDKSLKRYIEELKSRNLKVTLYPMFFMDLPGKPWRGHVTGDAKDVHNFFTRDFGYNKFILHYAKLTKDLVDGLVIGSELSKITPIRTANNKFPAVDELINLAKEVREKVGPDMKLTYAADWTEYHSTEDRWYYLDPLWADPNIDFVGIDFYAPITCSINSLIPDEDIKNGWFSNKGFDYMVDKHGNQIMMDADSAWKNLRRWWNSEHINPDGSKSPWQPRMKKVRFTEFGYPSIDKATNQPNVFFDPKCIDGNIPKNSTGHSDFAIQKISIVNTLANWQSDPMIDGMYLWAWDARPYPAWPYYNIWTDNYLWEKGHWINHKFITNSLASIISTICQNADIAPEKLEFINLDIPVTGVIFDKNISALDAINLLRCAYFFDFYQREDKLVFHKRGRNIFCNIDSGSIIPENNQHFVLNQLTDAQILTQIQLSFFNNNKKYTFDKVYANCNLATNHRIHFVHLPISLLEPEANHLAFSILNNARVENKTVSFCLPITYLELTPCDLISLDISGCNYLMRIIDIKWEKMMVKVTAIPEDIKVYQIDYERKVADAIYSGIPIAPYAFVELPYLPRKHDNGIYLDVAYGFHKAVGIYCCSPDNDLNEFEKLGMLDNATTLGKLVHWLNASHATPYTIDRISKFTIYTKNKLATVDDETELFGHKTLALLGKEIITFGKCIQLSEDMYEISHLIRGIMATDEYIHYHRPYEDFVLLGGNLCSFEMDEKMTDERLYLKVGTDPAMPFDLNRRYTPRAFDLRYEIRDNLVRVEWMPRDAYVDDWVGKTNEDLVVHNIMVTYEEHEIFLETTDNFFHLTFDPVEVPRSLHVSITTYVGSVHSRESYIEIITGTNNV